jgi:hypothetical protein
MSGKSTAEKPPAHADHLDRSALRFRALGPGEEFKGAKRS